MALSYDARVGYDFNAHWPHIQYIAVTHALPPLDFNATAPHPPLYYAIAAVPVALGLGPGALGWLSALWGILRLALIWVGLERWLPASRLARVVALALAAVLPIGAHLDGMITNETLVMLMSAAVLVAAPAAIAAAREGRVAPVAGLALLLGLAVMSKVSAPGARALDRGRDRPRDRARRRLLVAGVAGAAAPAGRRHAGAGRRRRAVLCAQRGVVRPVGADRLRRLRQGEPGVVRKDPVPRAPPARLLPSAGTCGIYGRPFFTTGLKPEARFFPVLIASTFNDYYVFSYWGGGKYGDDRWVPGIGVLFGCISNLAGTAVSLVTVIAWLGAVRTLWRRREDGTASRHDASAFALLLMPLGALLGQLHFATKYPNDNFGPIKGAYLQFVAPVLCALFGVGVDWMWRRRARWAWGAAALAAMVAVPCIAVYSVGARLPRFGPYANTAAPFFAQPDRTDDSIAAGVEAPRRAALLHRRRRRLHRQPLLRLPARARQAAPRPSRLRQLLLGARMAPRAPRRRRPAARRPRQRRGHRARWPRRWPATTS